ncbi:Putative Ig domain-containing protein [Pseudomonas delhiensis]|uniref:Ig domain-containing protein n=1 Tax=Pseudomonas delhiensis TaxID=366289 RepID=A0A239MYE1_9PSED|nr:Ig domain-containing protein [Pseudomonas delhiensis]SDK40756.1 Putative Ig domain-containing protein [Pseudomonas delhiensis]SNT47817.1 Putative Ig domain-containing protein [Pseudomonas delhiensis]
MQIIPLAAVASQTLKVVLAQQNCVLNVYQKSTGMYLDVSLEGETILTGVLCRDRVRCVRQAYLGFVGDLAFMDTEGTDDPVFSGLGSRWVLMYLSPEDLIEKAARASIDFQSRINAANTWAAAHPLVLTGALANGIQGVPYSSSITLQGQMANSALSWSVVGSLPAGLSLDGSTGVISGTPTAGLTIVSFTLKAKDNLGRTATSAQTVKIGQAFTMATQLPGIMSLTRPSIGTYFDPTAVLQVAANDQPRFDYDPVTLTLRGLLIEEQRTNLFLQSTNLTSASWVKGQFTVASGQPSVFGDNSAFSLAPTSNGIQPQFYQSVGISGTVQTISWIVKSDGATAAYIQLQGATTINSGCRVLVNLANGVLSAISYFGSGFNNAVATAIPLGNGRWLVSLTATTITGENIRGLIGPSTSSSSVTTVNTTDGLIVECPQFEAGAFPTSYIPTTSSQVTRAADVATITVPSGFTTQTYGFDDGTSAQETVSAGPHTIPTPTAPKRIKTIAVTA